MITVLMIVHNESEYAKVAVKSFRLFSDVDISFVIVDNGSTDGLQEWAAEQTDLTYVYLEERHMEYGKVINMVKKELEIDTDLLIMDGHYLLTPKSLSRMAEVLYSEKNVGAVGGSYNKAKRNQDITNDIQTYEEAIKLADAREGMEKKRSVMLFHGAILWKREVLNRIGKFEEGLDGAKQVMDDYCLCAIMEDKKLMVCPNAFLWKMEGRKDRDICVNEKGYDVLERKWGMHYFAGSYNKALCWAMTAEREDNISVLEIGCACGATLVEIKNRFPNAEVYGSEINDKAAEIAKHFAQVTINNIEDKNLSFQGKKFDYILLGDVLEHLHDPLDTLIYCKGFLCEKGTVIATIPNLMHISVMEELMRGDFTYQEVGLLDKTHIHMFTYNEIVRMFHEAGYEVEINATTISISDKQKKLMEGLLALESKAERYMYEAYQYIVRAAIECC